MAHYYLIAGHGAGDPGACANSQQEWKLARQFNDLLSKYLRQLKQKVTIYNSGGTVNTTKDMFQQTAKKKGLWVFRPDNRIVVETHLNSASKSATGTETLICMSLNADKYDRAMNKALAEFFSNRGIKKRSDLLNLNVAAFRGLNYRLNELCFISNKNDVTSFIKNMDKIAKTMAEKLADKKIEISSQRIGIGKFMGDSDVEVWCELFAWDKIVYYLNGLDKYRWGIKINTSKIRNIYSVTTNKKVGEFKPNSTIRYMSIPKGLDKKMINEIKRDQ